MVFEKVRTILVDQLDVEEEKVTLEASITEDLGADSLDVVDLVMSLEDEFGVEIPDDQVENIKTVGDIVKYIEENAYALARLWHFLHWEGRPLRLFCRNRAALFAAQNRDILPPETGNTFGGLLIVWDTSIKGGSPV